MKKTKVFFPDDGSSQAEDKDGNVYTHSNMTDDEIFEAIDTELSYLGLELLVGAFETNDYFFCIIKREEK